MLKIYNGVIKKVPTDEMFEKALKDEVNLKEITLEDTIRKASNDEEYLLVRLSYQSTPASDEDRDVVYKTTPILKAKNKEMRILCEMGEYHPVKVVATEYERNGQKYHDVVCVQDNLTGMMG